MTMGNKIYFVWEEDFLFLYLPPAANFLCVKKKDFAEVTTNLKNIKFEN
jgi:hypothetical protein